MQPMRSPFVTVRDAGVSRREHNAQVSFKGDRATDLLSPALGLVQGLGLLTSSAIFPSAPGSSWPLDALLSHNPRMA